MILQSQVVVDNPWQMLAIVLPLAIAAIGSAWSTWLTYLGNKKVDQVQTTVNGNRAEMFSIIKESGVRQGLSVTQQQHMDILNKLEEIVKDRAQMYEEILHIKESFHKLNSERQS